MFKKILIANRGEVAARIARACRELRIPSVAVFSEPDATSLHVRVADEAHPLGGSSASESYLNVAKILNVAKKSAADAVHPGFGFLSENANFAEACAQAGLKFIGPTPEAIRKMGDKIGAKIFLKPHGIPVIPGVEKPVSDPKEAKAIADGIGYPVLVKAAAGGGGKGMRVVRKTEELSVALEGAQREAKNAFNDDRVFIEKYIEGPRHIEIQVVADEHGKIIHLFERECSLQRRHQKVIEETPSVALDPELREKMGATAVKIAELIGYTNIGTMEFILDAAKNFYFLEANTRLQVEHPITEMVTGVDLVKTQIRIAAGEPLSLALTPSPSPTYTWERGAEGGVRVQRGHSIECRIYAEDPENNFLPSVGKITRLREPRGAGVRVDTGICEGWTIPMEYDPMLAKLVVHAPTRALATVKMLKALADYEIGGVKTNISFLMDLLRHPTFTEGRTDTGVIDRHFKDWLPGESEPEDPFSPWTAAGHWRAGGAGGDADTQRRAVMAERKREYLAAHRPHGGPAASEAAAPMPGTVRKILVAEGQKIAAGDPLVVIEAMKMEHTIDAPRDGAVAKVLFRVGDKVAMGEKLIEIK
jgi:acetyl-CoA carboxylase biotin carboxylase subunit